MDLIILQYIKMLGGNSLANSTYGQVFLHLPFPDFTNQSFFTGSLPITFPQQYKFDITTARWQNQSSPASGSEAGHEIWSNQQTWPPWIPDGSNITGTKGAVPGRQEAGPGAAREATTFSAVKA